MRATYILALVLGGLSGCSLGRVGDPPSREVDGREATDPAEHEEPPAFALPSDQPKLLPFWVRLQKVAAVMGAPLDDPALDLLKTNRIELGDYDHAKGIQPNLMWTPSRMALWAKSLKPVCASEAMHAMYPELPEDLDALVTAAHGRAATPEDRAAIEDALKDVPLDPTARYEAVCLAVLSSAEFVIQ